MSDYTIKNLMEIEDSAAGRAEGVEARFGRKHLDSEHLGISYFRYGPGVKTPGHRHREQEEGYVVVGGSGRVKLGEEIIDLRPWDVIRVSPNVVRAFEGGTDGLELIAIGSDRPEGGDGEIVQDFWTDQAQPANRRSRPSRRRSATTTALTGGAARLYADLLLLVLKAGALTAVVVPSVTFEAARGLARPARAGPGAHARYSQAIGSRKGSRLVGHASL